MEGKGNEMAFQLKVQVWQNCLCNEHISGVVVLDSSALRLEMLERKRGSVKLTNPAPFRFSLLFFVHTWHFVCHSIVPLCMAA